MPIFLKKPLTDAACMQAKCIGARFVNLGVARQGRVILHNVTAEAPRGGATVVIGPNGAGKTTLLRCLLGECAHTGSVIFSPADGESCNKPVIGYVPQQLLADAQMPLRVYEFLCLSPQGRPLWLGCGKKARAEAKRCLELAGARKLENRRLGELSGGELRRVLLASALSHKPDLLVLDEAEAGVDYRGERMFWELLDESRRAFGFTMIMVSHNLPLAAHYATHVICLKKRVIAEGPPCQTLTGETLLNLFGVPIHLYPQQCDNPGPACPQCGAFGNIPYFSETVSNTTAR